VAPEFVAEEDGVVGAGAVFVGDEAAAEQGTGAQNGKEVRGNRGGFKDFGAILAEGQAAAAVDGHGLEGGALRSPVEVIGGGDGEEGHAGEAFGGRDVPDLHEAGWVLVGEWA